MPIFDYMKLSAYPQLEQWLATFNHFPKNDALVDLDNTLYHPFLAELEWNSINVQKIIQQASESIKSYGVNPLTLVSGIVTRIGDQSVNIPFELEEISFDIQKIKNNVSLSIKEDSKQINPYLIYTLKQQFDLIIEETEWEHTQLLADKYGIIIEKYDIRFIGNYHPNRYVLRNELEQLIHKNDFSQPLSEQIELSQIARQPLSLREDELVFFDDDQYAVYKTFNEQNCLVQGPPGTGKSQLLIGILGKLCLNGQTALVASAKQTALDVIEKRMNQLGLGGYLFSINDSQGLKSVYANLALQWQEIESTKRQHTTVNIRPTQHNQLQFKLDIWNQPQLIGDGDWLTFQSFDKRFNKEEGKWIGTAPSLPDLIEHEELITKIYDLGLQTLVYAWKDVMKENSPELLREKINQLEEWISFLPVNYTNRELEELRYKQITYQLFATNFAQSHAELLNPDGKERKRLLKNLLKLEKLQSRLLPMENNRTHWKVNLSEIELENHLQETNAVGWWNKRLFKKKWKTWSTAPAELASDLIQEELLYRKGLADVAEVPLNIPIEEAQQIVNLLRPFTQDQWNRYQSITEDEKIILHAWSNNWEQIVRAIKAIKWQENQSLINQIHDWKSQIESCLPDYQIIQKLPNNVIQALHEASSSSEYINNALKTHWLNFKAHYPQLAEFEESELAQLFNTFNQAINEEQAWFVQQIIQQTKAQFESYHELLATPTSQLKADKKELKKQLKKGKAILLKEFAKKQQHLKLRSLLQSEAKIWIDLLQPIHLSNPIQLAKHVPLNKGMYDCAIVDESSQLLSAHSAGILQRANAVLIAGDEQQMQPHFFFQTNQNGESLMQHAKFILPTIRLTHHYRSAHSALIAFSNQHFYEGNLSVFPHYNSNKAIFLHPVNGQFVDRENLQEAQYIGQLLEQLIHKEESIGIVAFSQKQTELIRKNIPNSISQQVQEMENSGQLFILPLEKIQGDECDHLIISCTYGRNEGGEITQRFGLLSMDGGRNRLNVLATRASQSIHVVTSLSSKDISPSTNPNTELFRCWITYLEEEAKHKEIVNNDNHICIPLHDGLTLREILTRKRIYESRNWNIKYN